MKIINIVIIDDDPNIRDMVKLNIGNENFNRIAVASHRSDIITYLSTADFYIINAQQPDYDLSLWETLHLLSKKLDVPFNKLPVVIMTDGYSLPFDPQLPSFEKPFDFQQLIVAIVKQRLDYIEYKLLPLAIHGIGKWSIN